MKESKLPALLRKYRTSIEADWIREQTAPGNVRDSLIQPDELRAQCKEFLSLLIDATQVGGVEALSHSAFLPIREMLARISASRSEQGLTPTETAMFVFSLKRPVFGCIREELMNDPTALFEEMWTVTELLDRLGLFTSESYLSSRESVIVQQQAEMLELSTPVVKLWEGVLALPLIGTLDSNRTQVVMETLLQRIVETNSEVAIIDITGVPTVDTLVAQHLMKTVSAARLMGVDCIISGVRPQIAQTIVHLGVALGEIPTKSTLAAAFKLALHKVDASLLTKGERRTRSPRRDAERSE